MTEQAPVFMSFQLLRLDGSYHGLMANEKVVAKQEALAAFDSMQRRMAVAVYSLTGLRPDCDLLLWRATSSLEDIQDSTSRLQISGMGKFLVPAYSFLGLAPDASYGESAAAKGEAPKPKAFGAAKHVFLQPAIVRSPADHAAVREAFAQAAAKRPGVRLHAVDSGGMDDHDFVFAFEADEPAAYAALAAELRASKAAGLLTRETPVFPGILKDVRDLVDAAG